jgi:chromosomal replication initiation ATPase DnaA
VFAEAMAAAARTFAQSVTTAATEFERALGKAELSATLLSAKRRPSLEEITALVATTFNVSVNEIKGNSSKKRRDAYKVERWFCFRLATRFARFSSTQTALWFGYVDHTTVLYGCKRLDELVATHPQIATACQNLEQLFHETFDTSPRALTGVTRLLRRVS